MRYLRVLPVWLAVSLSGSELPSQESAAGDPWAGNYTSPQLTLSLKKEGDRYVGLARAQGQEFPLVATGDAERLTGRYQANGLEFPLTLTRRRAEVLLGADGQVFTLVRGASGGDPAPATATNQAAHEWQEFLAGKKAVKMESYSSGSSGGYSTSTEYHLCRNGDFLLRESGSMSVDTEGAYGYQGGNSQSSGTWRIVSQGSLTGIELRFRNGETGTARLDYQDGRTLVDGERWLIVPSEVCP